MDKSFVFGDEELKWLVIATCISSFGLDYLLGAKSVSFPWDEATLGKKLNKLIGFGQEELKWLLFPTIILSLGLE